MIIKQIKDNTYYIIKRKASPITLIVDNTIADWQLLEIVANQYKYFGANVSIETLNFPIIQKFLNNKRKIITKAKLKKDYINLIDNVDRYYFSPSDQIKLDKLFNIKRLAEMLSNQKYNTGRSWSQDHKRYNKAENWERTPENRKTKASNVKNLEEKKIVKKYTIVQLKKLASNYAYVTSGDLEKLTYRLLDKTYQSKLIPVYEKAIKSYNLKNPKQKV